MNSSAPLRRLVGQQFALLLGLIVALSCAIGWIAYSSLREAIVNDANRNASLNAKTNEAALAETLGRRQETTARMLAQLYDECGMKGGLLSSACALRKLKTFQETEGLISALVITPRGRHVSFGPPIDNKQIQSELSKGELIKAQSNKRTLIARFPIEAPAPVVATGEIPPEAFAPLSELRNRIILLTAAFAVVAFVLSLIFARWSRRSTNARSVAETETKTEAEAEAVAESETVPEFQPAQFESTAAEEDTYEILLKLARLTQVEMKKKQVNLSEMGLQIVGTLRDTDPTRAVTIKVQPELLAEGDPTLLGTVLENLLTISWKLTARRPDARIEIGELTRGQTRVYFVRDNGAGLNTDSQEKLFDAFQPGGMGIGLAIAKKILRRHAGDIWAEGKPGKGNTFFFTVGQPKPHEASSVA